MTQNLIVTPEAVTTAGTISYWRLHGAINLSRLHTLWTTAALNPAQLPKAPSPAVALGRAVRMEAGPRMLVRPLAAESTWAIVSETADDATIGYEQLCVVGFSGTAPTFTRTHATPTEYEAMVARIRANFDQQQGELAPEDISVWLVRMAKLLQAVPLRDTGGIYFIPRKDADLWRKISTVIEAVSKHSIFQIPAMRNDEAIRAITDAITQEADAAVSTIAEELTTLGDRALKHRREACDALLAKIAEYDLLLGVQLQCRERVEGLQASIAMALLVANDEVA
jgi:hypothetical protein